MFDSGISAKELIESVKSEVDVALPIPNASYVMWLNSLEQMFYSSIIQEQNIITVNNPTSETIVLSDLVTSDNEAAVRFDDIYTVYADSVQLIKTNAASGQIFPNCYYKVNNNMAFNTFKKPERLDIVYSIKPALKTVDDSDEVQDGNVMLPIEFIEIAKSKLRAEAYMIENEYTPAANWINNYNILLENFKQWLLEHAAQFGM